MEIEDCYDSDVDPDELILIFYARFIIIFLSEALLLGLLFFNIYLTSLFSIPILFGLWRIMNKSQWAKRTFTH
jgi:hypothetical protein